MDMRDLASAFFSGYGLLCMTVIQSLVSVYYAKDVCIIVVDHALTAHIQVVSCCLIKELESWMDNWHIMLIWQCLPFVSWLVLTNWLKIDNSRQP